MAKFVRVLLSKLVRSFTRASAKVDSTATLIPNTSPTARMQRRQVLAGTIAFLAFVQPVRGAARPFPQTPDDSPPGPQPQPQAQRPNTACRNVATTIQPQIDQLHSIAVSIGQDQGSISQIYNKTYCSDADQLDAAIKGLYATMRKRGWVA
jgi:hypothetical protein